MAMRRPRIKAVANIQLNAKRKPKTPNDKPVKNSESSNVNGILEEEKLIDIEKNGEIQQEGKCEQTEIAVSAEIACDNKVIEKNNLINDEVDKDNEEDDQKKVREEMFQTEKTQNNLKEEIKCSLNDSDAFKCPPKVEYQRTISHTSNSGADDVFYSDIEENALQMDLQKSTNGFPMSPSKNQTRQRIRPTPRFGQRRNSFVASSPSPHTNGFDDNQTINEFTHTTRRERYHSGSLSGSSNSASSSHHHTPHKYLPAGIPNGGRIRTESGCSVYSDSNTSSHKSRKTDEHNHRQHSRREFEARFVNGVPDKSALKMSDLIYWNPATNPMEQKPNPNVKLENADTSSNDVKPFVDKKKETDASTEATSEAEAVPVPQLKLNSNGELILDDKSLVIETTAEQEARKVLANSSLIYMDENTGMNGFYSRQKRTREWPGSETIKFYRCLQNVGTDFSLMVSLFPNRTRRDLKLKFKKEERFNGHLINKALLYPKQFNIEELKKQVEEEEKAREEEARNCKSSKNKAKATKKKKVCTSSVANRVLAHDDVYQNENTQKLKTTRKINTDKKNNNNNDEITDQTSEQINIYDAINGNNNSNNITENIKIEAGGGDKVKRRRRRAPNINIQKDEDIIFKEEIIKKENKHEFNNPQPDEVYNDVKQLESEMNELLYNNSEAIDATEPPLPTMEEQKENDENEYPQYVIDNNNYYEEDMEEVVYENRSYANLDDGSVNTYNDITEETILPLQPPTALSRSPSPETLEQTQPSLSAAASLEILNTESSCSSLMSERHLNEEDIQQILTELAEGSLVLVSTLDPDDPDKVLNEIYMVDKLTGDICDEPLNIPDNIVQCILSVMS